MQIRLKDPGRGVSLTLDYHRAYTGAFVPAGLSPVASIVEEGDAGRVPALSVQIPAIEYTATRPAGSRGSEWHPPLPSARSAAALEQLEGRVSGELRIRDGEREIARIPLLLLDSWQWPHNVSARVVSAVYVLPGDRAVARVVSDALTSPEGEVDPGEAIRWTAEDISRCVLLLWRHLGREWEIRYESPRMDFDDSTGQSHQRVRSPQEVLNLLAERRGQGNCLDMSLLLASCLESLGLQPVLCFVGSPGEAPVHVFPGVWTACARRFRPVFTDRAHIEDWVRRGDLLVFEATGVCSGGSALSAEAAIAVARTRVLSGEALHLVDIAAARPPAGPVRPLEPANDAAVQRALWRAQTEARASGHRHLEALHVLYGLCGPEQGLTRSVIERSGGIPERVRSLVERTRVGQPADAPPVPTQNFELCWSAARGYARAGGRSRVEEIDLLWAVIENPSRNVKRILIAAGCDPAAWIRELEAQGGRPGQHSMSVEIPRTSEGPDAGSPE